MINNIVTNLPVAIISILCLVTMFKPRFINQSRNKKGQFSKKAFIAKPKQVKEVEYWPIINTLNA
jgi:hypothetical protein